VNTIGGSLRSALVLAVVDAVENPNGAPGFAGVSLVNVDLRKLTRTLKALPLGVRGMSLCVQSDGGILASSRDIVEQRRLDSGGGMLNLSDAVLVQDSMIAAMASKLRNWKFTTASKSSAVFRDCTYKSAGLDDKTFCIVRQESVTIDGDAYEVLATPIPSPGLEVVVIIAALKAEFDGGLQDAISRSIAYSAAVLAFAAIVTLIVAVLVSRPLRRMTAFFKQLSVLLASSVGTAAAAVAPVTPVPVQGWRSKLSHLVVTALKPEDTLKPALEQVGSMQLKYQTLLQGVCGWFVCLSRRMSSSVPSCTERRSDKLSGTAVRG